MKILIADIEIKGVRDMSSFLQHEGHIVETAFTFQKAAERIKFYEYDCLLLGHELLGKEIFPLIYQIVEENKNEGIIILAESISSADKIRALDLGADDILTAPFVYEELNARLRAIVRRKKFQSKSKVYFGNLVIDMGDKSVLVWSNPVPITKKEFDILLFLISNKNRVVSKVTLAEYIWGDNASEIDNYEALFTHIKNLRRKLKTAKGEVDFKSIYGVGYQIIEI